MNTPNDKSDFSMVVSIREVSNASVPLIFIVAAIVATRSDLGSLEIDARALASTVLQVSGTMVALALPAAQLSYSFIASFEEEFRFILGQSEAAVKDKKRAARNKTTELRKQLFPAWRGVVFVFIGFILSGLTLLFPSYTTRPSAAFLWDVFFSVSSLLFVMVGAYWFYPTARFAFQLKILDTYEESFSDLFPEPPERPGR